MSSQSSKDSSQWLPPAFLWMSLMGQKIKGWSAQQLPPQPDACCSFRSVWALAFRPAQGEENRFSSGLSIQETWEKGIPQDSLPEWSLVECLSLHKFSPCLLATVDLCGWSWHLGEGIFSIVSHGVTWRITMGSPVAGLSFSWSEDADSAKLVYTGIVGRG